MATPDADKRPSSCAASGQLTGPGTYLPTARAVRGGGYSAIVQSSVVGPAGGQVLVDETVQRIEALWRSQP